MEWVMKSFSDLTTEELYEILKLRVEVFVVEQNCPYPEVDGHDRAALHLIGKEEGLITAYARVLPPGTANEHAAIGRVVVRKSRRGQGLARELVTKAKEIALEQYGNAPIHLSAQLHLESFYASCGFKATSSPYEEDGIPHVDMRLVVSSCK